MSMNSVLDGLNARRLAEIQKEIVDSGLELINRKLECLLE